MVWNMNISKDGIERDDFIILHTSLTSRTMSWICVSWVFFCFSLLLFCFIVVFLRSSMKRFVLAWFFSLRRRSFSAFNHFLLKYFLLFIKMFRSMRTTFVLRVASLFTSSLVSTANFDWDVISAFVSLFFWNNKKVWVNWDKKNRREIDVPFKKSFKIFHLLTREWIKKLLVNILLFLKQKKPWGKKINIHYYIWHFTWLPRWLFNISHSSFLCLFISSVHCLVWISTIFRISLSVDRSPL